MGDPFDQFSAREARAKSEQHRQNMLLGDPECHPVSFYEEQRAASRVILACGSCGEPIVKSLVTGEWVHRDDFVNLKHFAGQDTISTDFDHDPVLEVIDINYKKDDQIQ